MLKNFLLVTLRNIHKQKGFSLINIAGLAMGLACCILIYQYLNQERSFDSFHQNADRIYRFALKNSEPEGVSLIAPTSAMAAPLLKSEYASIQAITRIYFASSSLLANEEKKYYEKGIIFADPDFFKIFTFPAISGNPQEYLTGPDSLVLTAAAAEKYFGNQNPLGKSLLLDNKYPFRITGIIQDVPVNSHFRFDMVASFRGLAKEFTGVSLEQWGATMVYTYGLFPEGFNSRAFDKSLHGFLERHFPSNPGSHMKLFLQPLRDIHLYSRLEGEIEPGNSVTFLLILCGIGLFILLLAGINYVNLSTARSIERFREVAVRKVNGAGPFQLLAQYLGESLLMTYLALLLALLLAMLAMPGLSILVRHPVSFQMDLPGASVLLLGVPLLVGTLAGIYPAFFLARQKPAVILKSRTGEYAPGRGGFRLRPALVLAQMVISIVLITSTLIINSQLKFMMDAELGFRKDRTLILPVQDQQIIQRVDAVKDELRKIPGVESVASSYGVPIGNSYGSAVFRNGRQGGDEFDAAFKFVDTGYFEHFGLQVLAGRTFSANLATDRWHSFVVNQQLVRKLGYAEDRQAIGRRIHISLNEVEGTIIGVVRDFHNDSLQNPIYPQVFLFQPTICSELAVRLAPGWSDATLGSISRCWNHFSPAYPFRYTFLDEDINQNYAVEQNALRIVTISSALAIFIAGLGLFGMAAFSTRLRTREIGIRKSLGASTSAIVLLLSSDLIRWAVLANLIAWPLAYYGIRRWLQTFSYHVDIQAELFLLAGLAVLLTGWLATGWQIIRAARAKPVENLRYE